MWIKIFVKVQHIEGGEEKARASFIIGRKDIFADQLFSVSLEIEVPRRPSRVLTSIKVPPRSELRGRQNRRYY